MADIEDLMPLIKQFLPFAKERMGFQDPPRLFLKGDSKNAADPLGRTAFYDPEAVSITLYTTDRHPKDIMRSLSHELVHHTQNCNGKFSDAGEMGEGYAQDNPHMREMERQAYEMGNMCFRDWEDSIKQTIYFEHLQKGDYTMSTKDWKNGEIKTLLSEAWGFKMDLNKLNEGLSARELGAAATRFAAREPLQGGTPLAQDMEKLAQDKASLSLLSAAGRPVPGLSSNTPEEIQAALQASNNEREQAILTRALELIQVGQAAAEAEQEAGREAERKKQEDYWDRDPRSRYAGYGQQYRESKELYEDSAAKHRTAGDTIEEELEECGEMPDEGEVVIDIAAGEEGAEVGAEDPAARVGELMDELKGLLMQLTGEGGGEEEVAVAVDEPMEERRAKGRSSARNQRGAPDPRQRPGAAMQENRMREMVRKAIKEAMK